MNEEKSLKEIHEIREKLYLMDKKDRDKLLVKIREKYRNLFV